MSNKAVTPTKNDGNVFSKSETLSLKLSLYRSLAVAMPLATEALTGKLHWSMPQVALFKALLDKALPNLSMTASSIRKEDRRLEDYSREELELATGSIVLPKDDTLGANSMSDLIVRQLGDALNVTDPALVPEQMQAAGPTGGPDDRGAAGVDPPSSIGPSRPPIPRKNSQKPGKTRRRPIIDLTPPSPLPPTKE